VWETLSKNLMMRNQFDQLENKVKVLEKAVSDNTEKSLSKQEETIQELLTKYTKRGKGYEEEIGCSDAFNSDKK
jgi:hypothetical protein